jgi:hypothetical protein
MEVELAEKFEVTRRPSPRRSSLLKKKARSLSARTGVRL